MPRPEGESLGFIALTPKVLALGGFGAVPGQDSEEAHPDRNLPDKEAAAVTGEPAPGRQQEVAEHVAGVSVAQDDEGVAFGGVDEEEGVIPRVVTGVPVEPFAVPFGEGDDLVTEGPVLLRFQWTGRRPPAGGRFRPGGRRGYPNGLRRNAPNR